MTHKKGLPMKMIPPPNIEGIVINIPTTINATTTPVQEHLVGGWYCLASVALYRLAYVL
ncbi:MAG: hypothetical protein RTU63_05125 [Candidatus Thorarchaeota archaeon]